MAVVVSARLRELDLSIEEAAMDLGAKPWKVFFLDHHPDDRAFAGRWRHDVLRPVAGRPGAGQLRFRRPGSTTLPIPLRACSPPYAWA